MTKEEEKFYRDKGKQIAIGVTDCIATLLLKIFILAIIVVLIFNWVGLIPTDETDKNKWTRSNVELITDYGTGVQYLHKNGTLIPRLGKDGKITIIK